MGVATDQYALDVSADQSALQPGQIATLSAHLQNATLNAQLSDTVTGLAVSGGIVTFNVTSGYGLLGATGPGTLQTVIATTDENGNCQVTFTGAIQPSTVTASAADVASPAGYAFGVPPNHYHGQLRGLQRHIRWWHPAHDGVGFRWERRDNRGQVPLHPVDILAPHGARRVPNGGTNERRPNVADAPLAKSTRRDTRSRSLQRMVSTIVTIGALRDRC